VKIVALVADLMDRSRISEAVPDVEIVRAPSDTAGADVVVVDLGRYGAVVTSVRAAAPAARIVAYGSHVDDAALERARADGADVVIPRSRFFRDPATAVGPSG
jgi:threonine dehydrogenase-like Zn-dependent dehydrogenase